MKRDLERLKKIRKLGNSLHQKAAEEGLTEKIIRIDLHNIEKKSPAESFKKSLEEVKKMRKGKKPKIPWYKKKNKN